LLEPFAREATPAAIGRSAEADRNPFRYFERRTNAVDAVVAPAVATLLEGKISVPLAVAAVGGYGRRELFPHSDIDLLLVLETEAHLAGIKEPVAEFLQALWDAGLRASHSVRTIPECCQLNEQNVELHISLLDLRRVAGDRRVFDALEERLAAFYQRQGRRLTGHLTTMVRQRHSKFNDTVYHLEPNVKEAPGAIRDIHFLHWVAQLEPQHTAIDESYREMQSALEFLYGVRCFLHLETGRDNNLLTFEMQDEAARTLGAEAVAPEDWMRVYYHHARRVWQSTVRALEYIDAQDPSLIRQFRDWRSRLSTPEFTISRDRIFLRNAGETLGSPEAILRLFTLVARHGMALSWATQRRLREAVRDIEAAFRERPVGWPAWREMLGLPHAAIALHQMQEAGVLGAAMPEWHAIDSLVVRDFYHRYTVDEHTLVAIGSIDGLIGSEDAARERFRDLLAEEDEPAVLRFALLFHDIGKGTRAGDHVRGSLETAELVMERLRMPEGTREKIRLLIEHHLVLSLIMNGRDVEDAATARFLTSKIGTQEDLRRLALVTYADISAVNPTAMSPWRMEQLWRVYVMGKQQLTRELAANRIHAAGNVLEGADISAALVEFLEGLPTRYLRTHTREQMEHHLKLDEKRKRDGVAIEITPDAGAYLMSVLANDQPGLFAGLCGALASFGMNIVKAEAASNAAGCVLDFFRFTDPMRTLELNPSEMNRLQWTVECVMKGSLAVTDLLKRRRATPRPTSGARIVPAVRFTNEASDRATLIDFMGEDRPGLLYDLASAISAAGCNIDVVMIDTEAHKALDVFYVTRNGEKLDEPTQERLREELSRVAMPV
jgi:[protein-PII] uridylyltransferase